MSVLKNGEEFCKSRFRESAFQENVKVPVQKRGALSWVVLQMVGDKSGKGGDGPRCCSAHACCGEHLGWYSLDRGSF